MARKAIILDHGGGELANQLWNYANVYAYTLERGYTLENPSFFEYGSYFSIPTPPSLFKFFFFNTFKNYTFRKKAPRRKIWRKFYSIYKNCSALLHGSNVINHKDPNSHPYYLPPTKDSSDKLKQLEEKGVDIYFNSWLFRNPIGLKNYHDSVRDYFCPRRDIENGVISRINDIRGRFQHVIGIHIRQGDYKIWRGGIYFIGQKRVREIIEEFVKIGGLEKAKTCFIIASDGAVDEKIFDGLNIHISKENAVFDLFLLSKTDAIIGSNSTFGAFASYYGDIPQIVMQKESMDWQYYSDKKTFFENKYSTFVHY